MCPPSGVRRSSRLHRLYQVLRSARENAGRSILTRRETRILFDEQRKIEAIEPVHRNDAHKLIEECMLIANVATAQFLEALEQPSLFRVHEGPSAEKLENLRAFLGELSLDLPVASSPPLSTISHCWRTVEGREDAHIVQTMLLRSLIAGGLPARKRRSLWPPLRSLCALHFADPPLPRPAGAPRDSRSDPRPRKRRPYQAGERGQHDQARRESTPMTWRDGGAGRAVLDDRAPGRRRDPGGRRLAEVRVSARTGSARNLEG